MKQFQNDNFPFHSRSQISSGRPVHFVSSDKGSCRSCAGVIFQSDFGVEGRLQRNSAHTEQWTAGPERAACGRWGALGRHALSLSRDAGGARGKLTVTFLFRPTTQFPRGTFVKRHFSK